MAASNTWVFFTQVLPRAIRKYGGVDPEALRKARPGTAEFRAALVANNYVERAVQLAEQADQARGERDQEQREKDGDG